MPREKINIYLIYNQVKVKVKGKGRQFA